MHSSMCKNSIPFCMNSVYRASQILQSYVFILSESSKILRFYSRQLTVVQGAGGMQMIDPLYQRILIRECKRLKIPVIFDEVFTGFWRLGREVSWRVYSVCSCF